MPKTTTTPLPEHEVFISWDKWRTMGQARRLTFNVDHPDSFSSPDHAGCPFRCRNKNVSFVSHRCFSLLPNRTVPEKSENYVRAPAMSPRI